MQMNHCFYLPLRIYYEDTDAGGVVYHANYLRFFERARTEMLRNLGFEQDDLSSKFGTIFALRSVDIEYLKPAFFNELLQICVKLTEAKKASFTFEQRVLRNDETICFSHCRIACIDRHTLRPKAIPEPVLVKFLEHLS